jgi:predicted DNA-binding protein
MKTKVSISLPESTKTYLKALAKKEGRSLSNYIEQCLYAFTQHVLNKKSKP